MKNFNVKQIGVFEVNDGEFKIQVCEEYRKALQGLQDFSYLQIVWWFDQCDIPQCREKLVEEKPYIKGPDVLGTFATRSPARPNPIAVSTLYVTNVDLESGIIEFPYADAMDGTPVLDIKPYIPSIDKVENPVMPAWCSHWPSNVETSGDFDWENEFNF